MPAMRASLSATAILIGTLLAVGCSQMSSPTQPTSVSHAASPSLPSSGSRTVALGGSASTNVVNIPVSFTIQPGAKTAIQACVGEAVTFVGDSLLVAHQSTLPDGSTLLDMLHFNGQGAVAVGGSTGVTYRLVGADSNPIILPSSGGLTATFDANLLAIGPGSSRSFLAHILQHITITPDGIITALIDIVSIDCR